MFAGSALAYAQADMSVPHNRFVDLFAERFPGPLQGRVLDLGCGPADVCLRLARRYPDVRVLGVDGSEDMLVLGRELTHKAGMAERVELRQGYIPEMPLPRAGYQMIMSNSLLHHLADPSALWKTVAACLAPGGKVFVMDLMRPESREEAARLRDQYSAGDPPVLQQDFFNSLLAAYRPDEVREQLKGTSLAGLNVEVVSDRHFLVFGTVAAPQG